MTERQLRFVEEFIATGNASEAARRAGYAERYSNRMGTRLLNQINIRAAIDERLQAVKTAKTLEQEALLEWLSAVVTGEVRDEIIATRLTGKGCSVIERHEVRNLSQRLRAAEILLKIYGAFKRDEQSGDSLFVATLQEIWKEESQPMTIESP